MPETSVVPEDVADGSQNAESSRERGGGIQSIERAFSILTQISQQDDGINLADLSKAVGLHTSTTFHLVRTMVELGVVRQAKDTKRYHLGRMIFSLAASSSREVDLIATATPYLESLAQGSGEGSHFAMLSGDDVVIVARGAGTGAFQMVERAGGVRPAHCTGIGKVLLAGMDDARFEAWLGGTTLKALTAKSITDPEKLRLEIEQVRKTGVGYDDAEYDDEVRCVACPVRDFSGQVVGAVGVSGPIWRMTLQRMESITHSVRQTAVHLSKDLGYSRD
ncbi:IclR family transcriptional regulator [Ponticoccus alexandrii]|uniref:Helix-turn-helix domain-containing protein n=1 Tax=Ponticoccus alexandrii TaxID=1943633 RepID=A0ABX7FDP7_9RHOB|nr:IclR family transcriptional regulator [Ponticoccus alexandrii]QRF68703.1 helix-turn-helix domain-containing protein [Ponticoccus alexandrii]